MIISNAFDRLHEQLSIVRSHVESLNDPGAKELFDSMEFGLLAPMRKLRIHLNIPYDWREAKRGLPGGPNHESRTDKC